VLIYFIIYYADLRISFSWQFIFIRRALSKEFAITDVALTAPGLQENFMCEQVNHSKEY